jgi:type VI secretion system secreted protein Hcp
LPSPPASSQKIDGTKRKENSAMAMDQFIKLTAAGKPLEGESRDKVHAKSIDVLAWSWGVSNSGSAHVGGGAGAGVCNVQDLSFTKYVDKSTPSLLLACCDGKHFEEALLTVRKAGEKPLEYIKITLKEVLISSVSTGGSGGEDRLTENVSLNFASVKFEYVEQLPTGDKGATPSMFYNVAEKTKDT